MRLLKVHIILWLFIHLPALSHAQVILNVMSRQDSTPLRNVSVFDVYEDSLICKSNPTRPCIITTTKDLFIECKHRGFEDLYLTIQGGSKDTLELYMRRPPAIQSESLDETTVTDVTSSYLRDIDGMGIYAARKTERIDLDEVIGNKAIGLQRQIYAKVAGLNVWESSGSGLNTEIGARGLNPARSSNFNVRQNQYDIAADAIGYPDAYYVPPAEAIERIDIVRGASSLQYGPQFGGTINYHLKGAEYSSGWRHEIRSSIGSFGLYNQSLGFGYGGDKVAFYTFGN
ncbi:MAG: TonB-dependent receptor plug domain-containing protein, partial [Bacteroidota bacterium]|nr:TonB-dependent receptor plug domain-containing protein [Bacteroidota bacterium]